MKYSVEELTVKKEDKTYDRKSARKEPKGLSNHIVAFANADGGTLVIGIEDIGEITGIDGYTDNVNDILRVPFDFCRPSVLIETETLECTDKNGKPNHLLVITIPQSPELHANQQDDVYYRMGDKSQKLIFDDRLRLVYSKGSRYYEDEPVADSSIEDIDMDFVTSYCRNIGYAKSPEEYIRQNKSYIVAKGGREEMSGAARYSIKFCLFSIAVVVGLPRFSLAPRLALTSIILNSLRCFTSFSVVFKDSYVDTDAAL